MVAKGKKMGIYRATTLSRAVLMFAVDLFGYSLLLPWVIYRHMKGRDFKPERVSNIAVLRLDGIGDLVLSMPAIDALRKAFPEATITLFVNKWSSGLAELMPGLDKIIYLDAVFFRAFKYSVNLRAIIEERKYLRKIGKRERYDLSIDLRGDFFSILNAFWLHPRWMIARSSRGGSFLLTNKIGQAEEGAISEMLLNVRLIQKISKQKLDSVSRPVLRTPSRMVKVEQFLEIAGRDYICLAVAAPYATRCYPAKHWLVLINLIRKKYRKPIVVLGSADENRYCQTIIERTDDRVFNMAGRFTLAESAACINGSRLFIGNDGGLIHIASAFSRPLVQLFGPASSVCFGHFGKDEHVIHKACQFNPCAEPKCKSPDNWCMDRITPKEIYSIAHRYLQ